MINFNKVINFKYGSKPNGKRERVGLSKYWFFLKPDVGNLTPAPQALYSAFSSNPFTGGYPTGYGDNEYSAWNTPFSKKRKLIGFTHFTASGAGNIGSFYNFFLLKPCKKYQKIEKEEYFLGGYTIKTAEYFISNKTGKYSCHYSIESNDFPSIIPGYNGLKCKKFKSDNSPTEINYKNNVIQVKADYGYITIYWVIKTNSNFKINRENNTIEFLEKNVIFDLAYSFDSFENALINLKNKDYKNTKINWEKALNKFEITASKKVEKLFYTNLYHTLKNPFIYNNEGGVFNFMTLWDMYKTQLPLSLLFMQDYSPYIAKGLENLYINNCFVNSKKLEACTGPGFDIQACCLANILLSTASIYRINYDFSNVKEKQLIDLKTQLSKGFPRKPNYTQNLDIIDCIIAFNNAYNEKDKKVFLQETKKLKSLYSDRKILLNTEGAQYYEGTVYNYSFRVGPSIDQRLAFTNKEDLEIELDNFFGYKGKPCKRFSKFTLPNYIKKYAKRVNRFEGLNNEPDIETPYLYGLIGNYKKQNQVLNEIMNGCYFDDDSGLNGNDDSGALTSWYVWNALGIFPIVGTNRILIGCPQIDRAVLHLKRDFKIIVHKKNDNSIYLKRVKLNRKELDKFEITSNDILSGGTLDIYLN